MFYKKEKEKNNKKGDLKISIGWIPGIPRGLREGVPSPSVSSNPLLLVVR